MKAPKISARSSPKVRVAVGGLLASRAATMAMMTPPTAENVWKASERTATDPMRIPAPSSTTK